MRWNGVLNESSQVLFNNIIIKLIQINKSIKKSKRTSNDFARRRE
jgi:hypothetical protein